MPTLLAIDTSMNACTVALQHNGVTFSLSETMSRGQSERLMPMIMHVVGQAGITLPDVDVFAACTGPGTFTGIRVGLATIRALAQISGKPMRAISTFDAVAATANLPLDSVAIILETKRTDFYLSTPSHSATCVQPDDLAQIIPPDLTIISDENPRIKADSGLNNACIDVERASPDALISCALKAPNTNDLAPLYLRGADVSISRQKTATIR